VNRAARMREFDREQLAFLPGAVALADGTTRLRAGTEVKLRGFGIPVLLADDVRVESSAVHAMCSRNQRELDSENPNHAAGAETTAISNSSPGPK